MRYWELDGGGPPARFREPNARRDFAFPQITDPDVAARLGIMVFDYLYVSFTNRTAFSPTDTMPLTHWAKLLMLVQSSASIMTLRPGGGPGAVFRLLTGIGLRGW